MRISDWSSDVCSSDLDTQAAAALAGIAAGIGYQRLVQDVLGVALAKGETRSDCLRRPLSPTQLEYAADAVRHPFALHDALSARLQERGPATRLREDCTRPVPNGQRDAGHRWPRQSLTPAALPHRPGPMLPLPL